jgi:hypothetical protein
MKTFFILLAFFGFTTLHGQPPGVSIPQPLFQPDFPPTWPNEPNIPLHLFKRERTEIDRSHSFVINLKDSSQLFVEGKIIADTDGYYLAWTDTTVKPSDSGRIRKIYPAQTLSLVRHDDNSSTEFEGVAVGGAWLFTAVKGKLTVYTTATEDDLPDESLLYIRKDDGPIQNVTPDLLEQLLRGNSRALQLLHKGKIRKAIEYYDESARAANM